MNLAINSTILDIIVVICLTIAILIGLKKGLSHQLFMFVTSILIFLISWFASGPCSSLFTWIPLPSLGNIEFFNDIIHSIFYRIVAFIVISIILHIIRFLLRKMLEGVIDMISKWFPLLKWVDQTLGAILGALKMSIMVYFALVIIALPVFSNGLSIIQGSIVSEKIFTTLPILSEDIIEFDTIFEATTSSISGVEDIFGGKLTDANKNVFVQTFSIIKFAYNLNALSDEVIQNIEVTYSAVLLTSNNVTITQEQKETINETLALGIFSDSFETIINNKLIVR